MHFIFYLLLCLLVSCTSSASVEEDVIVMSPSNHDPVESSRFIFTSNMVIVKSGTGFMIGPNTGMTAGHVCVTDITREYVPGSVANSAYNVHGRFEMIVPVVVDHDNDICIFLTATKADHFLRVSKVRARMNEEVYSNSYPLGIYNQNVSLKFRGYYGGISESGEVYTVPGVKGSSGAAIYNKDNVVVGIMTSTAVDFDNLTLGPSLDAINEAIEQYNSHPLQIVVLFNGDTTVYSVPL
jgi:hypothetical protein